MGLTYNVDSVFLQGKEHRVCQDYALHGMYQGEPYVILSDGCSSAPQTDLGARILALTAERGIGDLFAEPPTTTYLAKTWGISTIHAANEFLGRLGERDRPITPRCLTATLSVLFVHKGLFYAMLFGDGCFFTKDEDGSEILSIAFPKNAPEYLYYRLDPPSYKAYLNETEGKVTAKLDSYFRDSITVETESSGVQLVCGIANHHQVLGLATDGVESFVVPNGLYPSADIVKGLADFKSFQGEFIKRRTYRLVDSFTKQNILHADDLSVGGIHVVKT